MTLDKDLFAESKTAFAERLRLSAKPLYAVVHD